MGKLTKRISTTVLSIATVVSLSGFSAFAPIAQGATTAELQAQIAALLAQITALQAQLSSTSGSSSTSVPASLLTSGNLTVGSKGAVVMDLQKFLNANGYTVSVSGAGSAGNETTYFGNATKAALAKWQAANGVSPAAGYFGSITRAKLATVGGTTTGGTTTGGTTTTVPAGSGLTVTLDATQPAAALAPASANRIPFTRVRMTASSDGAVTVNSVTVQRTGLAEDAALAGLILLDEDGIQLGLEKTLNSNHEATLGEAVTIAAGTSKVFVVAGRRAAASTRAGQTMSLSVVGVNTSAVVNATFPITGATHTINESLTIGSLTNPIAGPLDPGSNQTKEVGTTNYTFSSVKFTAGSAEKVYLKSIRWNQTGSAGKADLTNVKTYLDGTAYDVVVSADGKYYTSNFGTTGILVDKGFSKEISIKGDILGGSARTIDFDVDKQSDVYAVGETFGYGILPDNGTNAASADDGTFHSTNPWYDARQVLVSAGTLSVSKDNTINAQNIAINLANQPIGGWSVDVKGEQISVGKMVFNIYATDNTGTDPAMTDIDNISLYDGTGKVVAGPVDAAGSAIFGTITFTDTITFPIGVTKLTMKAKLATGFANDDTINASTTPSSDWTTVTGQTTGNTVTPSPTSSVSGNTMTVKAAALTISVSSVPIAQTVIAGGTGFEFAKYILDAAGSGEDVRLTSLPVEYNFGGGGAGTDLTNCYMYDGTTVLNGSNVVNPSATISSSTSFVFDGNGLTISKGTTKQISLKCDLKAAASGTYSWGYDTTDSPSPTGLTSGQTVTPTENDSPGQTMTAASGGTLTVATDSSSPAYRIAAPGETVELARIKYTATNESIDVKQVALQLTDGSATTSPIDLVGQRVTLHKTDGTQVGEATFSNSGATARLATSSSITGFVVPKDGAAVLVVKGTIAGVSVSGPITHSGDSVRVDYDGNTVGLSGNYGTGLNSGTTITPTGTGTSDTAVAGVRVMKAYPTVEKLSLKSGESTLLTGDNKTLFRFKVTANNGDIALYKTTFTVSSSSLTATTTKFSLYVYQDANDSTPDPNFSSGGNASGLVNAGNCYSGFAASTAIPLQTSAGLGNLVEIYPDTNATGCNRGTTTLTIPSGASRYFKLTASIASVSPSGTTETIQTQLEGDSAYPTVASSTQVMVKAGYQATKIQTGVDYDTHNDFIWSPISTTTAVGVGDLDYTNGYGVIGLPSNNTSAETITK